MQICSAALSAVDRHMAAQSHAEAAALLKEVTEIITYLAVSHVVCIYAVGVAVGSES